MSFKLINIEWNDLNGFILELFYIDKGCIDSCLFGLNISKSFIYIDLFYKNISIYDKLNWKLDSIAKTIKKHD